MAFLSNETQKHRYRKRVGVILALIGILMIIVWVRAFYGSVQAYKKGERYLKERQYIRAVTFFDRSIHWYTPFNPYVWKSAERLWEIGEYGEQQGDIKLALIACRTIRGGFYAASHFVVPGRKWIERCESKIDQLVKIKEKTEENALSIESEKKLLLQSQKTKTPDVFWSIVLEIGFFGWVLSAIGFILFVIGRKNEKSYSRVPTYLWIGSIAIFLGLWIAGMMNA